VGGLAKGHLVREIDALGGLMGRVADETCIQYRRLNTRKGLAVQASRAQVDIHRYPQRMQHHLNSIEQLTIIEAEATGLQTTEGGVSGVFLGDGSVLTSPRVCLTTGTFLRGMMHQGESNESGGRIGDKASLGLSNSLAELGIELQRLKTGTPPRLDGRSIDWERLERQDDTCAHGRFSFGPASVRLPQIDCHIAYTGPKTHDIIAAATDRSPLFTGAITGAGPRYCPSIEDKVVRFANRDRHLIFLEPEGLDTHRVYPNGLSTSLPKDVQLDFIRSIDGLQHTNILQYGYAVEYDFSDPTQLGPDLQHKSIPGLYLAGQVNGTSGYEEAAAQGFVAGISAALEEPFVLGRSEAYIGVLIDDLITRGVGGEPYRMFTSRAEHRLLLREDNADRRLMDKGRELGLVDDPTWALFSKKKACFVAARKQLKSTRLIPDPATQKRFEDLKIGSLRKPMTAEEILRRPEVSWSSLVQLAGFEPLNPEWEEQIEVDVKYEGYLKRAERRANQAQKMEQLTLPKLDWMSMTSLSTECRQRIQQAQPKTLGQLQRLPGITPVAVNIVAAYLARQGRQSSQAN